MKKDPAMELWSQLVKIRAGYKCEYSADKHTPKLNSHHIYGKRIKSTRYDPDNGICLCVGHHKGYKMSPHLSPSAFTDWLKEYRGQEWHDNLMRKAMTLDLSKTTKKEIMDKLRESIRELEG